MYRLKSVISMRKLNINKQRGIALLQVLLISAIISVLAMYLTLTSRQQIAVAKLVDDRANATLYQKSAESRIFFELLSRDYSSTATDPLPKNYNFYANPIKIDDYTKVEIQDVSGLINIMEPNRLLLQKTLGRLGVDENASSVIVDSLLDWQDKDDLTRLNGAEKGDYVLGPRNRYISLKTEMQLVKGVDKTIWQKLSPNLSMPQMSYFNPMFAPKPVLQAFLNDDAESILKLREQGILNRTEFSQSTGVYDNIGIVLSPSNVFQITFKVQYGEVMLTKQQTVKLDRYAGKNGTVIENLETIW
ncbi:type II secretion system minor pseudopilin [Shewanella baltica]|uniref:general secretion pathway protein GspK n=1 Tax=Shewanella baltica TaxID=62322 RepID=UPI00217E172E|nr:general secretion pathway protein GspK [Shewanella baltica]MCS6191616.1 general secretion pathway protein GspK [Shewanella baltica]